MSWGISDTCRDHRCLTTCKKQHRQNEPAVQIDVATGGGSCDGGPWTSVGTTDVSPPVKKKHRQNEPAGLVDFPTGVEVLVMGDPGHM